MTLACNSLKKGITTEYKLFIGCNTDTHYYDFITSYQRFKLIKYVNGLYKTRTLAI
jgi:hypothetical protein